MKKIILSLLALVLCIGNANATKTFASFGAPAGNGSWDSETNTYTWTASWSNLMPIFTFSHGELAEYTALHFTTSDYVDGPYRVCFMNGSTAVATIAFYSSGEKNLVLSERAETKDIDLTQITSIQFGGASGAGSVKLDPASVYLVKPLVLVFGEDGKAHITASDLDATGDVTIDAQTGEITSTGAGTFSVSLPNCDFSAVSRVDVTRSGDDICNTMAINDAVNGNLNTWYGSKYGCDFTGYQSRAGQVNKITWNVNAAGTMTVSDIVITSAVVSGSKSYVLPAGVTNAKDLSGTVGWNVTYPQTFAVQGEFWGNNGLSTTSYVNAYADYLTFVVSQGSAQGLALRVWVTDGSVTKTLYAYPVEEAASVANWEASYLIKTPGFYTTKITGYKISGVKADNNWGANPITVEFAYVSSGTTPVVVEDYVFALAGSGVISASAKQILDDATVTAYDATAVTGNVTLAPANPNAIIYAASTNSITATSGILVSGTTAAEANFAEGGNVNIPTAFTAAAATYTRTLPASGWSTAIIPFACEVPAGVKAYSATASESAVNCVELATIPANTPVILNGTGEVVFTAADAAIAATPGTLVADDLTGVYASQKAPAGSYVLQSGVFKKVAAGKEPTVGAFRAYLNPSVASAAELHLSFEGIEDGYGTRLDEMNAENSNEVLILDLYGRRVSEMKAGQVYICNGKKIVR